MAYESRTPDPIALGNRAELRPRIKRQVDDRDQRDSEAAHKFRAFFEGEGCSDVTVDNKRGRNDHRRVDVSRRGMFLVVSHRGHECTAMYPSMDVVDDLEKKLRDFCKKDLPHTKVFPLKR